MILKIYVAIHNYNLIINTYILEAITFVPKVVEDSAIPAWPTIRDGGTNRNTSSSACVRTLLHCAPPPVLRCSMFM